MSIHNLSSCHILKNLILNKRKNIFVCLFSFHNTITLHVMNNILNEALYLFVTCKLIVSWYWSLLDPNRISSIQNFEGLKLLTRVTLGFSHLADHKFRHNFQNCLNSICSCGQEIETTSHFLLHCLNYRCPRKTSFEKINLIGSNILEQNDLSITKDLFFGRTKLKNDESNALLMSAIEFIQSTERFKYPLFQS